MKFYCDSCGAKYLIGDDKVQGKILRIRCKKCDHVIVVRELAAPSAPQSVDSGAPSQAPQGPVWYYSRNGESFGPMPLEDIRGRIRANTLGDDIHLWHESFTEWKPARECAELADLFQAPSARKAPNPTISLSVQDIHAALEQQRAEKPALAPAEQPAAAPPAAVSRLGGPGGASAEILRRASLTRGAERGSAILSKAPSLTSPQPAVALSNAQPAATAPLTPLRAPSLAPGLAQDAGDPSQDRIRALRERLKGNPAAPLKPNGASLRDRLRPPGELDEPTVPKAGASGLHELRALDREVSRLNAQLPTHDDPPTEELKRPYTAEVMLGIGGVSAALPEEPPQRRAQAAPEAAPPSDATVVGIETPFYEPDPAPAATEAPPASLLEMPPTVEMSASAMLDAALSPMPVSVEASAAKPEPVVAKPEPVAAKPEPVAAKPVVAKPEPVAAKPEPVAARPEPVAARPEPVEAAPAPEVKASAPALEVAEQGAELDFFAQSEPRSGDGQGMFDLEELARNPPPISTTGLFGAVPQAANEGSALRPMSASAQASVAKEEGQASASLLIQLDKLQKAQRSRNLFIGAGILALLLLVGVSVFIVLTYAKDEKPQEQAVFQPPRPSDPSSNVDKPKGYSPEQLKALQGGGLGAAPAEQPSQVEPPLDQAPTEKKAPTQPPNKVAGDAKPADKGEAPKDQPSAEKEGDKAGVLARSSDPAYDPMKGNPSELMAGGAVGHTKIEGREKEGGDSGAPVEGTLSKEDIAEGFGNVRNSVTQCLERHLKREGTLPKGKVKLALTVTSSGEVTVVGIDPEVQDTLFFTCLQSHRTRWKFKAFSGSPLQLTKSFVLQ